MNPLKKGPELKMPELKRPNVSVPGPLADLYYDLRDRRLLLPLALVIVAIAATPFLLGSKAKVVSPPAGGDAAAVGSGGGKASHLTVVEARPGLRAYNKRLDHRSPTDPFEQRYTGLPPSAQVQAGGSSPEGSVTVTEGPATEAPGGGAPPSGTAPAPEPAPAPAPTKEYEFVIDVQIAHSEKTPSGGEKMSKWEARHDVPVLSQLPGKKRPVVTLLGGNYKTQGIIFLVAHTVKGISGEFRCASRTEVCELLEVDLGVLLEYIYEPTGVHYAIKVTNAAVIPKSEHKNKAARSSRAAFMLGQAGPALGPHGWRSP